MTMQAIMVFQMQTKHALHVTDDSSSHSLLLFNAAMASRYAVQSLTQLGLWLAKSRLRNKGDGKGPLAKGDSSRQSRFLALSVGAPLLAVAGALSTLVLVGVLVNLSWWFVIMTIVGVGYGAFEANFPQVVHAAAAREEQRDRPSDGGGNLNLMRWYQVSYPVGHASMAVGGWALLAAGAGPPIVTCLPLGILVVGWAAATVTLTPYSEPISCDDQSSSTACAHHDLHRESGGPQKTDGRLQKCFFALALVLTNLLRVFNVGMSSALYSGDKVAVLGAEIQMLLPKDVFFVLLNASCYALAFLGALVGSSSTDSAGLPWRTIAVFGCALPLGLIGCLLFFAARAAITVWAAQAVGEFTWAWLYAATASLKTSARTGQGGASSFLDKVFMFYPLTGVAGFFLLAPAVDFACSSVPLADRERNHLREWMHCPWTDAVLT